MFVLLKRTIPSTKAKRESSPARLTFLDGCHFVPRWRTKILPAVTNSPSQALMPRRWEWESRPFRVDPCPFLCAIGPFLLTYFPVFRRTGEFCVFCSSVILNALPSPPFQVEKDETPLLLRSVWLPRRWSILGLCRILLSCLIRALLALIWFFIFVECHDVLLRPYFFAELGFPELCGFDELFGLSFLDIDVHLTNYFLFWEFVLPVAGFCWLFGFSFFDIGFSFLFPSFPNLLWQRLFSLP